MNLNTLLECMNLTTSFCASGRQWGFHLNRMSLRCESLLFHTIKLSFLLFFRFFKIFKLPLQIQLHKLQPHLFLQALYIWIVVFSRSHFVLYGSIIFHLSSQWLFIMFLTLIHKFSTYCTCVPQQHQTLSHIICTKVIIKLPLCLAQKASLHYFGSVLQVL